MVVNIVQNAQVLIAVGANLDSPEGPPPQTFAAARVRLAAQGVTVASASQIRMTPAFPAGAGQPDYANAVWLAETALEPAPLLALLLETEAAFGRRREAAWAARPLDLDLIAYDSLVTDGFWEAAAQGQRPPEVPPPLILPHPRMHLRRFVLEPLAEIAPGWVHPAFAQTVETLLARVPDAA